VLARREEIAGRWVIALVGSRPLEDLGDLSLEPLARRAPQLCERLIGAVGSDRALERLRGGASTSGHAGGDDAAATGIGELVGARTPAELVDALELLRGVLCEALVEGLPGLGPRQTADLYERVAHVCATTLAAALSGGPGDAQRQPAAEDPGGAPDPEWGIAAASGAGPLIVDELEDAAAPTHTRSGMHAGQPGDAIAIRDQRAEHAPVEWLEAIARELERHEHRELPFAVLLVELRDLERLRLQSTPARLAADLASLERALAENGSVVRERPGRYWVLASGADRRGARSIADRLAGAVGAADTGEPLRTLVGIAVYPADGRHAAALAAHADVDLIAARGARS